MIIDDHSRLLVGGGLFYNDNSYNFQTVLKSAVAAYGIPMKLYADNGSTYTNEQLSLICGILGLKARGGKPGMFDAIQAQIFHRYKDKRQPLRQRITVHYNFSGLSDAEVAAYIRHKIACAGGSETIIDPPVLSAIHSHSQGNPRVIDNLMTEALLLGQQLDKKVIDSELILAAVSGLNLL